MPEVENKTARGWPFSVQIRFCIGSVIHHRGNNKNSTAVKDSAEKTATKWPTKLTDVQPT